MKALRISISKDKRRLGTKPYLVRWTGEIDPRTGTRKKYSKSFAKRKEAEHFAQQKRKEFSAGMSRDEKIITLEELCDKFVKARWGSYTKDTMDHYLNTARRLKSFFSPTLPIKHITQEYAEQFISQVDYLNPHMKKSGRQLSDSCRSVVLRNSKTIFGSAVKWGYLSINPFADIAQIKAKTLPWHYYSPEEFQNILLKTPTLRMKAYMAVQYGCGLRAGECLNLLWDGLNIDFAKNRINLHNRPGTEHIPPFSLKDYEERSVPMPDWASNLLAQLQEQSTPGCPFVFLTPERWELVQKKWQHLRNSGRGREWSNHKLHNNQLREFKRYCKNAGIHTHERITQHCLRKSWACNLANSGVPINTLAKMGGWSSIKTCEVYYLKCSDANEQKAVEALNRMVQLELVLSVPLRIVQD